MPITLSKEQFETLHAYAAMLANAEMVTMGETTEAHSYSLGDIIDAGSAMLDLLEAAEG